jgi:hypothetical protein
MSVASSCVVNMNKILTYIDGNEIPHDRCRLLEEAIGKDDHFSLIKEHKELLFDLLFECGGRRFSVEIKDFGETGNSDYINSIRSGHLFNQTLAARELGEPMIIAVLGDDRDVNEAIKTAASRNHRVDAKKLFQYFQMVDGFEANCIGLGIPVWRLKTDPWKRLLLRVRKILEGGDISGFAPKPSDGERQVVGLSILAGRGVGPKMAANILQRYNLCLVLRDGCCGDLVDCEGIGPKRAEMIRKNLEVIE